MKEGNNSEKKGWKGGQEEKGEARTHTGATMFIDRVDIGMSSSPLFIL